VIFTRSGDGYRAEAITEKGREVLAGLRTKRALPVGQAPAEAPVLTPHDPPALHLPSPEAWRAQFDSPYWAELAQRCLGCRVCTYDCPVCYCFDVRDRTRPDGIIERLRCWDSCQGAQCFAIAGGHNPRPTQAARQRQRYMHKFLYYPEREGAPLCVGCGRCVIDCPANVDIREVIAAVAAMTAGAQGA